MFGLKKNHSQSSFLGHILQVQICSKKLFVKLLHYLLYTGHQSISVFILRLSRLEKHTAVLNVNIYQR